ncbi:MAG TPA: DUF488 domain-containing protein [Candidatus Saccharimonadales bacterium]|nr:DUF488 domain-containing protein [Candidatus Saccharimonadales bacterium]
MLDNTPKTYFSSQDDMPGLQIKHIYEAPKPGDGYRVLVDRLWPRGLSKERAAINTWLKDISPSNELRTWFGHDPKKFSEFSRRYRTELQNNPVVAELQQIIKAHATTTLLYGAKDPERNQAVVLQQFLQDR